MYAIKAAVWLAARWRPSLISDTGLFDHDAFEKLRERGGHSGGASVMVALIAGLAYGEPFPFAALDRLDATNKVLALRAIECAAGRGELADIDENDIAEVA